MNGMSPMRWIALPIIAWIVAAANAEALAQGAPNPARLIQQMDRDGDGRISRAEFRGPAPRFDVLDADGDGYVTEAEFTAAIAAGAPPRRTGAPLPVIDTHVHLDSLIGRDHHDYGGAAKAAVDAMDQHGIRTSIVMSPPLPASRMHQFDDRELLALTRRFPGRFAVLGGGATLNPMIERAAGESKINDRLKRDFTAIAERIIADGAVGFGEMTALHYSYNSEHPFEEVRPDHPLFLLLADIAARLNVPIDLHIEAVPDDMDVPEEIRRLSPLNPARTAGNIAAFERLLAHNRGARIIWAHAGMDSTGRRTIALTRRLLGEHSNLYVSLNVLAVNRFDRNVPLPPGSGLNPQWLALIEEFSDRFVFGSDHFYPAPAFSRRRPQNLQPSLQLLQQLPPELARKVAVENAQRLFGLPATDGAAR